MVILEPVLSHTEKSCKASNYRQFSSNIRIKIIQLIPVSAVYNTIRFCYVFNFSYIYKNHTQRYYLLLDHWFHCSIHKNLQNMFIFYLEAFKNISLCCFVLTLSPDLIWYWLFIITKSLIIIAFKSQHCVDSKQLG